MEQKITDVDRPFVFVFFLDIQKEHKRAIDIRNFFLKFYCDFNVTETGLSNHR